MLKARKIIFVGVIIITIVGSVYYTAFRREKKLDNNHSRNTQFDNDSATHSDRETLPVEPGDKPEKNPKDGSITVVEEYIKSNAKNPATFEFLEWSEVSLDGRYWKVRCKYRGISSFNAEVTTNAWFYIRNNKVVHMKIISKI